MKLKVKKIDGRASVPRYAHDGDACFDLTVLIDDKNVPMRFDKHTESFENVTDCLVRGESGCNGVYIVPGDSIVFHTGLKFETDAGYNMKLHVRSSTGLKKNLVLSNGTGVIDTAQYRGEIMIGLTNIGNDIQKVVDGERVVQAEIVRTLDVEIIEVDSLSDTERGEGGIGSTGGH